MTSYKVSSEENRASCAEVVVGSGMPFATVDVDYGDRNGDHIGAIVIWDTTQELADAHARRICEAMNRAEGVS